MQHDSIVEKLLSLLQYDSIAESSHRKPMYQYVFLIMFILCLVFRGYPCIFIISYAIFKAWYHFLYLDQDSEHFQKI